MPKKPKHPKDMTTDGAMRHLFRRKGHSIIKKYVAELNKKGTRKG
jgi:hypothetical protein